MVVTIKPSVISGTIQAPASKSSMQRACAAALLHQGETIIHNPGKSNDDVAALDVIVNLGAIITEQPGGNLLVKGSSFSKNNEMGNLAESAFSCGESGLGIRMFAPIAALSSKQITINGEGSLLSRPMDFFDEIFPQLGINIESNKGKLPIKITGPLQPKNITIDGSLSSQFLTGMLFAFGSTVTEKVVITVTNLKSTPYIDLTLKVMKDFGYEVENNNYQSFSISPKILNAAPIHYTVEGDWSGASFLLVAGAIAGNVIVEGLDVFSAQADKKILEALSDCGCHLSIDKERISVSKPLLGIRGFHFNATDCPDLFPPLVALAAYCNGKTIIKGVSRLAHKESNRALTLQEEFGKMGILVELQDDLMIVQGGTGVQSAAVHSHHDHRIAMACAVVALNANGEVMIEEANAINKSYPDFYRHFIELGALVSL